MCVLKINMPWKTNSNTEKAQLGLYEVPRVLVAHAARINTNNAVISWWQCLCVFDKSAV